MRKDIERQRQHFESVAKEYYIQRQSPNHLILKNLMWEYFFKDKSFLKKNKMLVLEPMCGYGEGKHIIEKHLSIDVEYEGFDYSNTLVDYVKKNNPMLNIYSMDVTKFSSDKSYDMVILIGGLHHVPTDVDDILKKIHGVIKKGGYFISLEPTHNNFVLKKIRERIYKKNPFFDEQTEMAFELKELNELFMSNKFIIADQIYPGLLSYVMYYNPDVFPMLNIGKGSLTKLLFKIDKMFFRNIIGEKLSFATLTLLQKE